MPRYKNLNGNSGVSAYEIEDDFIIVQFSDDTIHLYSDKSVGAEKVREMKKLATSGKGLNTYITTMLSSDESSRLR